MLLVLLVSCSLLVGLLFSFCYCCDMQNGANLNTKYEIKNSNLLLTYLLYFALETVDCSMEVTTFPEICYKNGRNGKEI